MLLPRFEFHRPAGIDEACEMMAEFGAKAKLLAGGTDLLVNMKHKRLKPAHVVSLDALEELAEVSGNGGGIAIGAGTRISGLLANEFLNENVQILIQAGANLGSPLIRNRATVGGNLATARPAGDMAPPLMALDAGVVLKSKTAQREVPLDEFFLGPGQSVITPEEIMVRIRIPAVEPGTGGGYQKLGLRQSMEIGIVNTAAVLTLEEDGETIKKARVVLGSVAPTPVRSPEAEKALTGAPASAETFTRASRVAVDDSCAIDDFRGTIAYRCQMVEVLTRRALETALENARQSLTGGRS